MADEGPWTDLFGRIMVLLRTQRDTESVVHNAVVKMRE